MPLNRLFGIILSVLIRDGMCDGIAGNKWKALRYERKVYVHVAGTIAISPADAAVMLMHFPHIKRQVIVPQGVDTAYYTPNSDIVADTDLLLLDRKSVV